MKVLAILIGKAIILLGKILKRGSSLPGDIALTIDKNLLKKFKLPKTIIAVTGSSGKGSTASIIYKILKDLGHKVVFNASGANLTAGITTMLMENCTLTGKVKGDVVIFEMDERYAKFVFPHITPTHVIVTNITKDQPPRQGNVDIVYEDIQKALPIGVNLILNADDPYLLKFNLENQYKTMYYGVNQTSLSYEENIFKNLNIFYCPKCGHKLKYDYYHFETLGQYACPNCELKHPDNVLTVTNINYENFEMTVNDMYHIKLPFDMLFCVYNTMAAFTLAFALGLDLEQVTTSICSLDSNNKIYSHYMYNSSDVYLLNNKNENSTTFNQSILFAKRFDGEKTIIIGWHEISRRYEFNDLSWLYDIDFEILKTCNVTNILCVGPNAYDIATRIKLTGFNYEQIKTFDTLEDVKTFVNNNTPTKYILGIVNFDYILPFKKVFDKKEETL